MKGFILKIPLLFFVLWFAHAGAQTINTSAATASSCTNDIVVPISVTNCNGVGAISLVLNYNNTQLTYAGYQNTHSELAGGLLIVNATATQVIFSWAKTTAANIGNDVLIELVFTASTGTGNLTWDTQTPGNCEYSDVNGNILPSSYTNGSVTLHQLPIVNTHPVDRTVLNGQSASFSATGVATGITYRWQVSTDGGSIWTDLTNIAPYSGTTTANLNISAATMAMNGYQYRCRISGTCTPPVESNPATLTVLQPVTTTLPTQTICPGNLSVPVVVNSFNSVGAFSLTFSYNSSNLVYDSYQDLHPALSGGSFVLNDVNGIIYMSWASGSAASIGNDTLVKLNFNASAGTSALTWDTQTLGNFEYSDEFGYILPVIFQNGNITTRALPTVLTHPINRTIAMGQNTTFATTATGTGITYRWQVSDDGGTSWTDLTNIAPYSGTTTATLNITNAPLSLDGNLYRCRVTGTCPPFVHSNGGLLHVLPNVVTNGQTFTTCPGSTSYVISVNEFIGIGAFSICLNYNSAVLTYTGFQNLHPPLSGGFSAVNEAAGKVYITWSSTSAVTIPNGSALIELLFDSSPGTSAMTWDTQTPGNCEYSDINGEIVYSTWNNGTLTFQQPPVINSHPVDRVIHGTGSTTFSVSASGTGISYRWQVSTDGGNIWNDLSNVSPYSGTTTTTLTINPVNITMDGNLYRCRVTGTCAPVAFSDSALLTVTTNAIYTSVQNTNYSCGGEIVVPINVQNCDNVGSISLALNYDSTKLTFIGYQELNPLLPGGLLIVNGTGTKVFFSWASTTPANIGNSTLVKLVFQGNAGINTQLTWDTQTQGNCEYSDPMGNIITSFYTNGTVNILNVYPVYNETDNVEICDGDTFQFGSQQLTSTGIYIETFQSMHGCDSTVTLTLTVNPVFEFVTDETICGGETYFWRGNDYSVAGTYYDSLLTVHNCDSVYVLNLTVHPTFEFVDSEEICDGDVFSWHGNNYTTAGTYYDSLLTIHNCDSVYVLNLTVNPSFEFVQNEEICDGDIFFWRGNSYDLPGTYYDSLISVHNCDSVYVLILAVNTTYEFTQNEEICDGDIFTWRGNNYTIAGTYYDSLLSVHNCDSVYVLNLTVNPTFAFVDNEEICDGDIFTWRGNNYATAGTYYDSLLTVQNCDSIYVLNLSVYPNYEFEQFDTICDGQIFSWQGNNYNAAGTYYDSLLTTHGCDSIYILHLAVNPTFEFVQNEEICDGDIFTWRGNNYSTAGTYYDSLLTVHNCDSVYVLNLIVHPTFEFVVNEEICDGDIFTWRGNNYTTAGTYYDSLLTVQNCDSIYVLNLSVYPNYEFEQFDTICDGQIFSWQGNNYSIAGTYYDSLLTTHGCDSIYILHLAVNPTFEFVHNEEICDGDIFTWRGNNYSTAGTYYDSLLTVHNCDSVYVLNLIVHPTFEFVDNEEICDGDIFTWRGNNYTTAGTYYDSLLTVQNCDSIYVLNLSVYPNYEFEQFDTICDGQIFSWQGNNYSTAGTYYDSLLTTHGCDSIYILHLTVNPLPNVSISGLDTFYCDYHSAVTLTGSPSGGTFSGQGVSGNVFDPAIAGVGTWAVVYSYTDGNTCTNTDTVFVEVSDCVGIETTQKQSIKLFPNPNDGKFIIELHEESNITVINSLGAPVHRASYAAGSHSLDLSYLPSGVYLIKSESKDNVNVLRVIISPK
jgi:hypothetical protein